MMNKIKREPEEASKEHQETFSKVFKLRPELKGNPVWENAFEYARKYKLNYDEIQVIGSIVIKKIDTLEIFTLEVNKLNTLLQESEQGTFSWNECFMKQSAIVYEHLKRIIK